MSTLDRDSVAPDHLPEGEDLPDDPSAVDQSVRQSLENLLSQLQQQEDAAVSGYRSLRDALDVVSTQLDQWAQQQAQQVPPETEAPVAVAVAPAAAVAVPPQAMPVISVGSPAESAGLDLEQIVFGTDLAPQDSLAEMRGRLLGELQQTEAAATALVGQILIFRAASPDRMAQLLKDVGEAYYAWSSVSPAGPDPLRDALVAWLHARCERAGIMNRIELVHPGDRYDVKRHNAKQKGIEVDHVAGWIVVRDNGKVYTKATVTVR